MSSEGRVPVTLKLPQNAVFLSGGSIVIEMAPSLVTLMEWSHAQGAHETHQSRNRKPNPSSKAIRREAKRLKAKGWKWRLIAETIWSAHPEWFPNDPRQEDLRDKPRQREELLSRIKDRIRGLCKNPSPLEE
jgi:hypothetical protein